MLTKIILSLSTQVLAVLTVPVFEKHPIISFQGDRSLPERYNWTAGYVSDFTIHSSCNATQRHELQRGLDDLVKVTKHAKEHILVHGRDSPIYNKYFGPLPTGSVIGWYDKIATANRKGIVFRCDDPDKNCQTQKNWHGHSRGANASMETVICELSFLNRLPLEALCARGFDIATGKPYRYWGFDLMHRLFHVKSVSEGVLGHVTHGYLEALDLANSDSFATTATNTDSLIYFAAEAYAFDISVPGEGCVGKVPNNANKDFPSLAKAPIMTYTKVIPSDHKHAGSGKDSTKAEEGSDCHTHDDGTVHCI